MPSIDKPLDTNSASMRAARGKINAYLERNRGARQYRHAPAASYSVGRVMRPLAKKFGPGMGGLKSHWPEIVGDKWAALSRPLSLRGGADGKTLTVIAKGPAGALLSAHAGALIGKINQYLGAGSVAKLKIVQGKIAANSMAGMLDKPPAQKSLHPELDSNDKTSDNSLKAALDALGDSVRGQK